MDPLAVSVARYSMLAGAVFALLFVADFLAIMIYVARGGDIDPKEGHVVTENRPLTGSDVAVLDGTGTPGGRYWGKHKVLLSRSTYITAMSLVDGTATKAQRRLVRAMKLGAVLFWLAWICGGLALMPSQPVFATLIIILLTGWFLQGARLVRKGRADALRKLKERQESREAHRH